MMSFDSKVLLGSQKMRTHVTMVFVWSELTEILLYCALIIPLIVNLTEFVCFTLKTLCCGLFDCNFNMIASLQNWKGILILLDNDFKYFLIYNVRY